MKKIHYTMEPETATRVYDVLVKYAGAKEDYRQDFIYHHTQELDENSEYRFQGSLGFGGKFYTLHGRGFRVTCYPEDRNRLRNIAITQVNAELKELESSLPPASF